ncbi:hypothetical protein [Paraburkholderia sp. A3RO-2L]|uniref:hypothetical protein n=1 Tax=Paraburkholderia sp. A3RO-2L TaxID=3028376 RepID=UPI003DA8ECA0
MLNLDNPLLALDPPGCNRATLGELHRFRVDVLSPAMARVALEVWEHEVPPAKHPAITTAVNRGVQRGIQWLMKDIENSPAGARLWLRRLPPYWEPPVGDDAHLPHEVARAIRWTACDLALAARNSLEDLHSRYTSDENMPTLNRALRNTCYRLLLENPGAAWRLSDIPRILMAHADQLKIDIPRAAG